MIRVGVHVSIAGSLARSVERAERIGCDTFQIFSRNPRGWSYKDLDLAVVNEFRDGIRRTSLYPPVDHMPYLPNLASGNPEIFRKSIDTLSAELERCNILGIPYLVTHLGHYPESDIPRGRDRVIEAINASIGSSASGTTYQKVILLLENTAGEKNAVGSRFEDIAAVLEGIENGSGRAGFCLDTCHAFGAGYDLRTEKGIEAAVLLLEEHIGLDRCLLVHLNDSRGGLGCGLDRHEHIGLGTIGEGGFRTILSHEFFRKRPLICETPVDERRDDAGNIRKVRELAES